MARSRTQAVLVATLMVVSGLLIAPRAFGLVPASMSGVVRDSHGTPQMGALVEVRGGDPAYPSYKAAAYTDRMGHYQFMGLPTGKYRIEAMAAMFLPTLRENLHIRPGQKTTLDLTLSTLFEVQMMIPAQRRAAEEPEDNWKWTLRSSANRPVLRLLEDGSLAVVQGSGDVLPESSQVSHRPMGIMSLGSGSQAFGEGGARAAGLVQGELRDGQSWMTRMDAAAGQQISGAYSAGYIRRLSPASEIGMTVSYRQLPVLAGAAVGDMRSLVMRSAQSSQFGDLLDAEFGNETEIVRMSGLAEGSRGSATAMHPFARVKWHGDGPVSVEYAIATATGMQRASDLDDSSNFADVGFDAGGLELQRALHQELSVERSFGSTQVRGSVYTDRISNPLLEGGGWAADAGGEPTNAVVDPATGAFRIAGPGYSGAGFLIETKHQFGENTWATIEYANGEALSLPVASRGLTVAGLSDSMATIRPKRSNEMTVSLHARSAHSGTEWRSSYRWQSANTMTAVDPFHASGSDPYLSLYVRQRLPESWMLPNGVEVVLDVRNLLAEGYHPVILNNGQTVYFAQLTRTLRGGVEFSF